MIRVKCVYNMKYCEILYILQIIKLLEFKQKNFQTGSTVNNSG